MRIKAFAVIDTNVVISSLISKEGFTSEVFDLVNKGNIIPIFDKRILDEYYTVSHYEKFQALNVKMPLFSEDDVYDILHTIVENGLYIMDVAKEKGKFIDNTDIPFFEVKMSSQDFDSYLVTGNAKHFPVSDTTVSPKEMLGIMKYLERFVLRDIDYDKKINELINNKLSTPKYTTGRSLLDKMFDENTKTIKNGFFR